jgi:hypothetical protein
MSFAAWFCEAVDLGEWEWDSDKSEVFRLASSYADLGNTTQTNPGGVMPSRWLSPDELQSHESGDSTGWTSQYSRTLKGVLQRVLACFRNVYRQPPSSHTPQLRDKFINSLLRDTHLRFRAN